MREVAERHAEKWLTLLLDDVERGEAIVITRGGHAVAELAPASDENRRLPLAKSTPEEIRAAMLRIRARAKEAVQKFDWNEIKAWRDEGRA